MESVRRNTWCEIDLAQFRSNLQALRPSGVKMLLVVKGNAYGHGIVPMALEAIAAGVDMLGVGTVNEAEALLAAGIDTPILVISPLTDEELAWCVSQGVHVIVWRRDQVDVVSMASRESGVKAHVHIELDFGMARSGATEDEFVALLGGLDDDELSMVHGLCAHFAFAAVAEDFSVVEPDVRMFERCVERLRARGVEPLRHVANSAGTLRFPETHFDMVRMGVSAYGISSTRKFDVASLVSPILTWKATVTNVRLLGAGRGVMYGWEYVAETAHRVATIGLGYADGYHRHPAGVNTVLVNGIETPVLGRIGMDQCVFRVPDGLDVRVGDEVVVLGVQGDGSIPASTLATRWETNAYDVVIGIRDRVPRVYV